MAIAFALIPRAAALAQSTPPPVPAPATVEHHRSGLFLAIEVGYAVHALSRGDVTASGRGVDVRVAGGGLLTPRIALFGGYATFESSSITYHQAGMSTSSDDTALDASSFFAGARAYLPLDFYLEPSLGTLTERFDLGSSGSVGWMGQLAAGKEWRLISRLTLISELRGGLGSAPRQVGTAASARHLGVYIGFGYAGD